MGRKKPKLNIDELLKAVDSKDIQEFMTPIKPLKRKMHIKIIGFKDNGMKEKLAVKKNESIKEIIVDFNSANREISKIKMIRGEIARMVMFYRLKEFGKQYNSDKRTLNKWLNNVIYNTENIDYFALHERVFILRNDGAKRKNIGVVSIHFKDKLNIPKPCYMGDIVDIASCSTTHRIVSIKEVLDEILKQFGNVLPRIRLVANSRVSHAIDGMTLKNIGWYRSSSSNNGGIDGWFPRKVLSRQRCAVRGSLAVLSTAMKEYYSRRIRPTRPSRNGNRPYVVTETEMNDLVPTPRRLEMRAELVVELKDNIENAETALAAEGRSAREISVQVNEMVRTELMRRVCVEAESISLRQAVHHDLAVNGVGRIGDALANRLISRGRRRDMRNTVVDEMQEALIEREQELREDGYGDDIVDSEIGQMIDGEILIRVRREGMIERARLLAEYGEEQGNEQGTEHSSLAGTMREVGEELERARRSAIERGRRGSGGVEMLRARGRRRVDGGDEHGVTDEEADYRNLPIGTTVIIGHGNSHGRTGLSDGRERCITVSRANNGDYLVKFDNNEEWVIYVDEIVEVVTMDGREGFTNLVEGTIVVIRKGNNNGRTGLSDGRTRCTLKSGINDGWYDAEFEGHINGWNICADEIIEVVGRE